MMYINKCINRLTFYLPSISIISNRYYRYYLSQNCKYNIIINNMYFYYK